MVFVYHSVGSNFVRFLVDLVAGANHPKVSISANSAVRLKQRLYPQLRRREPIDGWRLIRKGEEGGGWKVEEVFSLKRKKNTTK